MPTSFIKSTIERFQSSFSALFAANPFKTAATSTTRAAGAPAEEATAEVGGEPAAAWVPTAPDAVGAGLGPPPKIFDISLLNNPICFQIACLKSLEIADSACRSACGKETIANEQIAGAAGFSQGFVHNSSNPMVIALRHDPRVI